MDRRTEAIVATALWVGPVLLGIAVATWIIIPPSPRAGHRAPAEEPRRDDPHRLQGNWEGVRVERDGRIVYEGRGAGQARVVFAGASVIFEDRGARLAGTFEVDPSRTPKTFDLTVDEGARFVTYPAGIYRLSGDTFWLCFAFPSTERPMSFATSPGSGRTLFIYRRTRPE